MLIALLFYFLLCTMLISEKTKDIELQENVSKSWFFILHLFLMAGMDLQKNDRSFIFLLITSSKKQRTFNIKYLILPDFNVFFLSWIDHSKHGPQYSFVLQFKECVAALKIGIITGLLLEVCMPPIARIVVLLLWIIYIPCSEPWCFCT
jgi:hypothetical protein